MHQVVVAQLAAARQGTHKTKGRAEVTATAKAAASHASALTSGPGSGRTGR